MKTMQDFLKDLAKKEKDFGSFKFEKINTIIPVIDFGFEDKFIWCGELEDGRGFEPYFWSIVLNPKVCEVWFGNEGWGCLGCGDGSCRNDPWWQHKRENILHIFDEYCLGNISYQEAINKVLNIYYDRQNNIN